MLKRMRHCCSRTMMRMWSNDNYSIIFYCQHYGYIAFRYFMSLFGPLMLLFGFSLISAVYIAFLLFLLPTYPSPTSKIVHFTISSCLLGAIFFNYASCSFTPPGSPEVCPDPGSLLGERAVIEGNIKTIYLKAYYEVSPGIKYKYCKACKAIKPPRAHHCSVTGKCVYHMDHYCPWMNNCVGYYNYRYFYLFLLYLQIGCGYAMILTGHSFSKASENINLLSSWSKTLIEIYIFTIALAVFCAAGLLFSWHTYLLCTNQTTIEFYINWSEIFEGLRKGKCYRNQFDKGWRKNICRVLGDPFQYPWYISILPRWINMPPPDYPFDLEVFLNGDDGEVQETKSLIV